MIKFLLTTWWIYIPIICVLLFLTFANNQRIKQLRREQALREMSPEERQNALLTDLKRRPGKLEAFAKKYGLRGIFSHLFPKK